MLDAVLLLAHRVSGLGVESELMRASPNFDDDTPRFVALSAEALDFVNTFRAAPRQPRARRRRQPVAGHRRPVPGNPAKIRKRALTVGTSLHLSYLLTRSEQSIERLRDLVAILGAGQQAETPTAAVRAWGEFAHAAFIAENRRNSLRFYLAQNCPACSPPRHRKRRPLRRTLHLRIECRLPPHVAFGRRCRRADRRHGPAQDQGCRAARPAVRRSLHLQHDLRPRFRHPSSCSA